MELNSKQKIILGVATFVIVIAITVYLIITNVQQPEYNINDFFSDEASEINVEENETKGGSEEDNNVSSNVIGGEGLTETTIVVHITGEIKNPGIIELSENARIADAIKSAGGVTKNADLDEVNLAYTLSDGQKINIPSKNKKEVNNPKTYITSESGNNVIVEDSVEGGKNQKVNINEAKQEQLEELPGIGPSIAKKIIEHRNINGKFQSIEQLKEVSGIGEAKFSKIKDYIVVK